MQQIQIIESIMDQPLKMLSLTMQKSKGYNISIGRIGKLDLGECELKKLRVIKTFSRINSYIDLKSNLGVIA